MSQTWKTILWDDCMPPHAADTAKPHFQYPTLQSCSHKPRQVMTQRYAAATLNIETGTERKEKKEKVELRSNKQTAFYWLWLSDYNCSKDWNSHTDILGYNGRCGRHGDLYLFATFSLFLHLVINQDEVYNYQSQRKGKEISDPEETNLNWNRYNWRSYSGRNSHVWLWTKW